MSARLVKETVSCRRMQLRAHPVSTTGLTYSISFRIRSLFALASLELKTSGQSFVAACTHLCQSRWRGFQLQNKTYQQTELGQTIATVSPRQVVCTKSGHCTRTFHAETLLSPTESQITPSKSNAHTLWLSPAGQQAPVGLYLSSAT